MTVASRPDLSEPCARGFILKAFRSAAHEVFGEAGLADITARLQPAVRDRTASGSPPPWVRETDLIEWAHAVWEGPAKRDRPTYNTFLQRQIDHGTGRVQRALISIASPKRVIDRAPGIWSSEHSHGALEVTHEGENAASVRLRDHPYTETPQARATIAEVFRYVVSLTRTANVTESHALDGTGVVVVRLSWR